MSYLAYVNNCQFEVRYSDESRCDVRSAHLESACADHTSKHVTPILTNCTFLKNFSFEY